MSENTVTGQPISLVLGSSSPNRRELFDRLGVRYEVREPDYDEVIDPTADTDEQVRTFAAGKAASVWAGLPPAEHEGTVVLGFDSMICCDGRTLGKAPDRAAAATMLQSFVGRRQTVHTGVCLRGQVGGKAVERRFAVSTAVQFRSDITTAEIEAYLDYGDWAGKCGAYSILGTGVALLASIEGDFQNIIGVPVIELCHQWQDATGLSPYALFTPRG